MIKHGNSAIAELEKQLGRPLTDLESRIAELEGHSSGYYKDYKGNATTGAGKTGEYANMPFDQVVSTFEDKTRKLVPNYDTYPDYLKNELVQAAYRGDLKGSPKFRKHLNSNNYKDAAIEFLNNAEYQNPKTPESVKRRMEAVSDAVISYGQNSGANNGIVDLLAPIRDREKQRQLGEQMGDIEFQMDVAPNLNYQGPIDVSKYRLHTTKQPDRPVATMGFRAPPIDEYAKRFDITPEEAKKDYEEVPYEVRYMGSNDTENLYVEPGTVNAINPMNANDMLISHEYRHDQGIGDERQNRLYDAWNAQNEDEWYRAVRMWASQKGTPHASHDVMEKDLIENLKRLRKNKYLSDNPFWMRYMKNEGYEFSNGGPIKMPDEYSKGNWRLI